jgi:hypothetical protein
MLPLRTSRPNGVLVGIRVLYQLKKPFIPSRSPVFGFPNLTSTLSQRVSVVQNKIDLIVVIPWSLELLLGLRAPSELVALQREGVALPDKVFCLVFCSDSKMLDVNLGDGSRSKGKIDLDEAYRKVGGGNCWMTSVTHRQMRNFSCLSHTMESCRRLPFTTRPKIMLIMTPEHTMPLFK